VECAALLETLRRKSQALILVDVAARIVGTINHALIVTLVFSTDSRSVPFEPLAAGDILAGILIVVNGTQVVTTDR
jgi:hypothetical protein